MEEVYEKSCCWIFWAGKDSRNLLFRSKFGFPAASSSPPFPIELFCTLPSPFLNFNLRVFLVHSSLSSHVTIDHVMIVNQWNTISFIPFDWFFFSSAFCLLCSPSAATSCCLTSLDGCYTRRVLLASSLPSSQPLCVTISNTSLARMISPKNTDIKRLPSDYGCKHFSKNGKKWERYLYYPAKREQQEYLPSHKKEEEDGKNIHRSES